MLLYDAEVRHFRLPYKAWVIAKIKIQTEQAAAQ